MVDLSRNPFASPGDKDEIRAALTHRLKVVREFIGRDISDLKTLDIAGPNKFGKALGIKDSTLPIDLNDWIGAPSDNYDVITFFEVLEHLMDPLSAMRGVYHLLKPGGVCYLSTPEATPLYHLLMSPYHLTEYRKERIEVVFRYAGFEITKFRRFCLWDWWFAFWGVRPMLRVLFHKNNLWELRRPLA